MKLPKLNNTQQLYLQTIFDYFHLQGTFPTFRHLEGFFYEKEPDVNIDTLFESLPKSLVESSSTLLPGKPVLTVPAMYLCKGSEEDIKNFLHAIRICVDKYINFDEEPQITFAEISSKLDVSPLLAHKVMQLLLIEPQVFNGISSGTNYIARYGIAKDVLRFRSIKTIEEYLEKRDITRNTLEGTNEQSTKSYINNAFLFEKLIAELLLAMGFTEVDEPKGRDRGFDYQAKYSITNSTGEVILQQWIIETKYYSRVRIGREVLDRLLTSMRVNNADKALLVTNTSLSSFAKELVTRINLGTEQQLEVWDGQQLATLLARFPNIQKKYNTISLQSPYVSPTQLGPKQIDLIERLKQCQSGKQDCYKYESICIEILTKVFVPPLKPPKVQARTLNGLERRDALFSLRGAKQDWEEIRQEFEANFLLCEFKNYVDGFDKDEVNQTRNYLRKDTIGRLGIIFSRKGASESAVSMRNSVYSQERKVILFFEDKHLIELLRMKETGRNPLDLIQDAIEDFLISYE